MENTTASASGATSLVGYPDVMRVLVVDEDPIWLTTLTQMLQRCGYQVTAKASPEEALREVRRNPEARFDLVMTVARTRGTGIDGFALLKHLKNRLPVILFSGDEPVGTVKRAIKGGASDFLAKPLSEEQMQRIWKHVVRWRLHGAAAAANGPDPHRKRGPAGAANDSGEGASQQQKKTKLDVSPHLHASFVKAAELLRGTEGYCPRGIRDFLEAQGVEVTTEQATRHLEIHEKDYLRNDLSAIPMAISSHYNNSKSNLTPGSSGSYMRSQGASNINQTRILSNDASLVGGGALGNESYRASHDGHVHNNGNHHGNADGYGNHYGGLPRNGSMVSASLSPNLAQQVQQEMTGSFPSNMMRTMNYPSPIRPQQEFPQISRLSYNASTGGISMSPWDVDDGYDPLRGYLGMGMPHGMPGDGASGQTNASQPQDLTNLFSWETPNGNGPTGTSGGSGAVTERMECVQNEDDIEKFFNY